MKTEKPDSKPNETPNPPERKKIMCPGCGEHETSEPNFPCRECLRAIESRMGSKPTPEKLEYVRAAILGLKDMRGFPSNEKALARIVKVVATFVDIEPQWHFKLREVVIPFEWLMDRVAAECEYFPMPVVLRRMYEVYFSPLDSREYNTWRENLAE